MTDFTPEQIEAIKAAIDKSAGTGYMASGAYLDNVIAELTKPKWTPKVGCYYISISTSGRELAVKHLKEGWEHPIDCRPITAAEIGLEPFEYKTGADMVSHLKWNDAISFVNATLFPQEDK